MGVRLHFPSASGVESAGGTPAGSAVTRWGPRSSESEAKPNAALKRIGDNMKSMPCSEYDKEPRAMDPRMFQEGVE